MAKKSTKKSKTITPVLPIILKKHEQLVNELLYVAEWVDINTDNATPAELQELIDINIKRNSLKITSVTINSEDYAVVSTQSAGDYIYKYKIYREDCTDKEYIEEGKEDFNEDDTKRNFTKI